MPKQPITIITPNIFNFGFDKNALINPNGIPVAIAIIMVTMIP